MQYSYFSVISRFPLQTVHPFQKILAVLPPPVLYKVETANKFWIHASNIVCGVRGGVGAVRIEKRPSNAKVSQDFCPWLKLFCLDIFDQLVGFYSEPIRARRMIVNYLSFWFSFGIC